METMGKGQTVRYELPLDGPGAKWNTTVEAKVLSSVPMELPSVAPGQAVEGEEYQFMYAIAVQSTERSLFYDMLVKLDVRSGEGVE